ncbi:DNA-directed RNA polymerase subunit beta' [Candidatus Vidania fulgoroideorum]
MNKFNKITIKIASPKTIKKWSYGEIKNSETINYRTLKPENNGLFCSKIFGPTENFFCNCLKFKRIRKIKKVCDICKVENIDSSSRRNRMAYIKLNIPICHIWYLKYFPSKLSIILNLNYRKLEKVIYYKSYIILKSNIKTIKVGKIINKNKYYRTVIEYGNEIIAKTGSEGIYQLLKNINIKKELIKIKKKIFSNYKKYNPFLFERFRILKSFKKNKIKPEWLFVKNLPVLPPDLRPLLKIQEGKFASSDLNKLYKNVLDRNNRLKKMKKLNTPDLIILNEKKMLQEAVDSLFDNFKSKKILKNNNRALKSISDNLKGKTGRFRLNLLGKRVDYSGRSVIVVDPNIKINYCKIPIMMGIELFKPHIIGEIKKKYNYNLISAEKLFNKKSRKVLNILKKIIKFKPIILNRAPTLHRVGIQAFYPILTNKKAIFISPLVCSAFNADFDGDQMAVHIPLSYKSQLELKTLLISSNKILSIANGEPLIFPSQEMLIGLFYITKKNISLRRILYFSNISEVLNHYNLNNDLTTEIYYEITYMNFIKTTVGRILIFSKIKKLNIFKYLNKTLNKKNILKLIKKCLFLNGKKKTINFINHLKKIGFYYSTIMGFSLSIYDINIDKIKYIIKKGIKKEIYLNFKYLNRLISKKQKKEFFVINWNRIIRKVDYNIKFFFFTKKKEIYKKNYKFNNYNFFSYILKSGSKGSYLQTRQILGIKGLIYKPNLELIEYSISSNYINGLDIIQYFLSSSGARKGLSDTSLKTANSGYLTRKLINVAGELVVLKNNCLTSRGIEVKRKSFNKINGRISLLDIYYKNKLLIKKNQLILEYDIKKLYYSNIKIIFIRSPIFCNLKKGICAMCYGVDLSNFSIVNIGEPIGIIAAQSIGEPGTQLTMRTFHIGGVKGSSCNKKKIIYIKGFLKYSNNLKIEKKNKYYKIVSKKGKLFIFNKQGKLIKSYKIYKNYFIDVKNNSYIRKINIFTNISSYKEDITEGLNTISNLFEVRNQGNSILSPLTGILKIKNNKITITNFNSIKYINTNKKINIKNNSLVLRGKKITNGKINNSDLLNIKGINNCVNKLLFNIQNIYLKHKINIDNKHIELIIRQMLKNIKVKVKNNLHIFNNEIINNIDFYKYKKYILKYKMLLTGISSTSINKSFISSASFQETIKILINSAIFCKTDYLKGIKENIITGKIIPVGTGLFKCQQ